MKPSIVYAFEKVRKVIFSCETQEQLAVADKMRIAFNSMFIYGRLADSSEPNRRFYTDRLWDAWYTKCVCLNSKK